MHFDSYTMPFDGGCSCRYSGLQIGTTEMALSSGKGIATALIVSNHAAFAGGALMIYTKNKNSGKYKDYDLHLKVISPLGYQK